MQLTVPDSRYRDYLVLGVQTYPHLVERCAHWKACKWAPTRAKSYSITGLRHTDYHGHTADAPTGYASFRVAYFSTLSEGEYPIRRDTPYPFP